MTDDIQKHYDAGYREGLLKRAYRQGYEAALNGEARANPAAFGDEPVTRLATPAEERELEERSFRQDEPVTRVYRGGTK